MVGRCVVKGVECIFFTRISSSPYHQNIVIDFLNGSDPSAVYDCTFATLHTPSVTQPHLIKPQLHILSLLSHSTTSIMVATQMFLGTAASLIASSVAFVAPMTAVRTATAPASSSSLKMSAGSDYVQSLPGAPFSDGKVSRINACHVSCHPSLPASWVSNLYRLCCCGRCAEHLGGWLHEQFLAVGRIDMFPGISSFLVRKANIMLFGLSFDLLMHCMSNAGTVWRGAYCMSQSDVMQPCCAVQGSV